MSFRRSSSSFVTLRVLSRPGIARLLLLLAYFFRRLYTDLSFLIPFWEYNLDRDE